MPFCGNCGSPVGENEQCPQCGELCSEAGDGNGLEIDGEALASSEQQQPGVSADRATDAQIGASVNASALMTAGEAPAATEPARIQTSQTTFEERERPTQVLVWRLTRIPVLLILGWFTASHLFFGATWVFIDNVNILIHEAGHVAFSWAGQTVHALGGTLGQLLMPAAFVVYFAWWRRERFAAAVCVWWLGENLLPIALYMKDAPTQDLPLIGGNVHDWNYLFGKWDLLHRAGDIAEVFHWVGILTMVGTMLLLVWWTLQPKGRELEPTVD